MVEAQEPNGPLALNQNLKYTRKGQPQFACLTGREDAFAELGDLTTLYEGLATHVRQHVNPLSDRLQVPTEAPQWDKVFDDPTLPLQVDVGSGSGRFVLIRAQRMVGGSLDDGAKIDSPDDGRNTKALGYSSHGHARANVLGLEIREKLVTRAQAWAERLGLRNCGFIFTNATVSWKSLLQSYPGPVDFVSMQFPDPHFKQRHHKRRHVQPQLVKEVVESLAPGVRIFLQGDVPEAVRWMRDMFERHAEGSVELAPECHGQAQPLREDWETPCNLEGLPFEEADESAVTVDAAVGEFSESDKHSDASPRAVSDSPRLHKRLSWSADISAGWLASNPLNVPTEREVYVGKIGAPVYRVMLLRV